MYHFPPQPFATDCVKGEKRGKTAGAILTIEVISKPVALFGELTGYEISSINYFRGCICCGGGSFRSFFVSG